MRKMKWDCDRDGCFNKKKRLKLGVFDDCFPGRMGFGDIDGIIEIQGFVLMLEWKSSGTDLPRGQSLMFERITNDTVFTVLVIEGEEETMTVERLQLWFNAKPQKWLEADLEKAKEIIRRWYKWAQKESLRV